MRMNMVLAAAVSLVAASPAYAVNFSSTGTTAGKPTYNRPLAGVPPTGLSGVGTAVAYDTLRFTVTTSGSYTFLDTSVYDNFMSLYSGIFNAAAPLTNIIVANDDLAAPPTNAGFTASLVTGTTYIAVMTSFSNADSGAYTLTITGPGTIVPTVTGVPETATWAMMLVGFGGIGATMRYRRRSTKLAIA